jgi:adenine-specific DNA-methyltransferase
MTETTQPEKIALTSMDIAEEKREQVKHCIAATFPEIMAEDKIDLDQLRRVLGEWVEPDRERFGLSWPGKAACMKVIQAPSVGTLKPCRDESVDWDTTENLFIEGDNLEVLKLLQKAYFGKIKMIYIDPPYNTGKEFIYPDNYAETLDTYLEYTGQKDSEGRKFSTNSDTSGRFHSRWLSMMYPRLYLSKNLLSENGVIFISIDDNEVANLKLLCDYVFGEENFVSQLIWNTEGNTDNQLQIKVNHQSILLYCKDKQNIEEAIGYVIDPNTRDDSNLHKGFADNNITKNGVGNPPQIIIK